MDSIKELDSSKDQTEQEIRNCQHEISLAIGALDALKNVCIVNGFIPDVFNFSFL